MHIILNIYLENGHDKRNLSCTTIWLIQFYPIYIKYIVFKLGLNENINLLEKIDKCDFPSRLEKCKKKSFKLKKSQPWALDFMIISQFLLDVFTPLLSVFGIVTNLIVIVVVLKSKKILKEKQYVYMAINSVSNIFVFLIQLLSLMNECQYPFGIYCSSVRKLLFVQYFKIIFTEAVSSFFRLISNFTYVAFSMNRLALIGKNGTFLESVSKHSTLVFMIVISIISVLFSIVKGFRYKPNYVEPTESYPMIFYRSSYESYNLFKTAYPLIFIFNALYDLVNYVLFALINFILDLVLLVKMRQTLKEKEAKIKSLVALIDKKLLEKKKQENDEVIKRTTQLIISNALVSLVCKIPASIISLNDLRILISTSFDELGLDNGQELFKFPYTLNSICYLDQICVIFQSFCNFLFLVSLSLYLFFYFKFDKKFQAAYYSVFGAKTINIS